MMKKLNRLSIIFLAIFALYSCRPEEPGALAAPESKLDGINDSFTLISVTQVDRRALGDESSLDVSDIFTSNPTQITFSSSDFTYSVVPGSGPNFLGDSGTWAFDDIEYPTTVTLTPAAGAEVVLWLNRTIRPRETMLEVEWVRSCSGAESVSYRYMFARQ